MVQKEVKRKAQVYGLMAILLASMFVALIYSYGTQPGISPNGQPSPSVNPSNPPTEVTPMKTFASYDDLKNFLTTNSPSSVTTNAYWTRAMDQGSFSISGSPVPSVAPTAVPAPVQAAEGTGNKDYSTTNIQVAGVDEADTVKTDGKYLYVIANNSVYILNADPQDARVLAKLTYPNTYLSGIYLSQDGSKLAVLGNQYVPYDYYNEKTQPPMGMDIAIYPYYRSGSTFAYVYSLSNKNSPQLVRNFTMSGSYFNSRMIGNYVYNIVTESAYVLNGTVLLPSVYEGALGSEISANRVYAGFSSTAYGYQSYTYTTFVALNIMNDAQEPSNMTIMLNGANTVYVSTSNIYVTYPVYEYEELPTSTPMPTASDSNITTIMPMPPVFRVPSTTKTAIYRIHVADSSMVFAAQGNVTGNILDQYSMDESSDHFRVATTAYFYNSDSFTGTQQNNIYVLDMNLNLVGKVENIATGEDFHTARFMGDRCYLVTFNTIDPLFVIDLSQPNSPAILGNLTIPGYSDFLQPYDETHLIGIGKDANASIDANLVHTPGAVYYTAILGLKLSLFDVSDVHAPKEVAKIIIGDRGTDSPALSDPHALLFDYSKNLLVIPVSLYLANATESALSPNLKIGTALPPTADGELPVPVPTMAPSWQTSEPQFVWQGAYVFRVTLDGGFEIRGNVTQLDSATLAKVQQGTGYYYYGMSNQYWITRTLYIGSTLYTISEGRVQLNSLEDFSLIAQVDLT